VLEPRTWILSFYGALVDQIVKERTQGAHLKVDGGQCDQALVTEALLLLASDLVVVNIGPRNRLDGLAVPDQPPKMIEHLGVPAHGLGFVRGMRLDMREEQLFGIGVGVDEFGSCAM